MISVILKICKTDYSSNFKIVSWYDFINFS